MFTEQEKFFAVGFLDGFSRGKLRDSDNTYKKGYKFGNEQIRSIKTGIDELQQPKDAVTIRPFIPGETIEYYVLFCIESDKHQASMITQCLNRTALHKNIVMSLSKTQVSGALQRLKSKGLAIYNSRWDLAE